MALFLRPTRIFILGVCILTLGACHKVVSAQENKPLTSGQLLALVAGESLPESIAQDIHSRGLAFKPAGDFRMLLAAAGADAKVLAAFDKAKPGAESDHTPAESLKHLSTAGNLMRSKNYEGATRELDNALQSGDDTAAAFVMGAILTEQRQYEMASKVYAEILERDSNFPQAHTKLSFVLYKCENGEDSLREAKAALAESPENAEAHKNAGNALLMERKYDAAMLEFNEALRIKPDYEVVRFDMGYMLDCKGDRVGAMEEYRKALALNPNDVDARYNLGTLLDVLGQNAVAVPELREAKRLDPSRFDIRMNLGDALYHCGMYGDALHEFRDLVALFPNAAMGHTALGNAYAAVQNDAAAEKEYRTAAELDPSDVAPVLRLGELLDRQRRNDEALQMFQRAEKVDEKSAEAHTGAARMLVVKKDYVGALREFKRAEELNPGDASIHDLYARALQATGESDLAIAEFKQAVALDPADVQPQLRLATMLETKGDWVAAMEQYRKAAMSDGSKALAPRFIHQDDRDAQKEYKDAQARFQEHLVALKAAGKTEEAAKLESAVAALQNGENLSTKLDGAMQAGYRAIREGRANDALQSYKQAVQIAEQLNAQDRRLSVALGELGRITMGLKRFDEADTIFQRQLKVVQETPRLQPTEMIEPLENLGMNAMYQQKYDLSRTYLQRSLELAKKNYGEKNTAFAAGLHKIGLTYFAQQDYTDAEVWLLRAVKIDDEINGYDGYEGVADVTTLCAVYDRAGKPDKSAQCYAQLVTIGEKRFGQDNPILVQPLTSEASALRAVGRNDDAAKIEQRIKTLQARASN